MGSLVAVLANHWVVVTLKHCLWEISITPFLRVVFKTLEMVINRRKPKRQSSGNYGTETKSCPKSFITSCFWELLHDIIVSGLEGAQAQPHLTWKPDFFLSETFWSLRLRQTPTWGPKLRSLLKISNSQKVFLMFRLCVCKWNTKSFNPFVKLPKDIWQSGAGSCLGNVGQKDPGWLCL